MVLEAIEVSELRVSALSGAIQDIQRMWETGANCARCSPGQWREGESVSGQEIYCVDLSTTRFRVDRAERTSEIIPGRARDCPLKKSLENRAIDALLKGMPGLGA